MSMVQLVKFPNRLIQDQDDRRRITSRGEPFAQTQSAAIARYGRNASHVRLIKLPVGCCSTQPKQPGALYAAWKSGLLVSTGPDPGKDRKDRPRLQTMTGLQKPSCPLPDSSRRAALAEVDTVGLNGVAIVAAAHGCTCHGREIPASRSPHAFTGEVGVAAEDSKAVVASMSDHNPVQLLERLSVWRTLRYDP